MLELNINGRKAIVVNDDNSEIIYDENIRKELEESLKEQDK